MAELIDRRRPARLILGLCMIGLLTLLMGGLMRSFVRGVVLGGLMSAATLALLTLIAIRYSRLATDSPDDEALQFRISTLMILMALIAVYLSAMREFVIHMPGFDGKMTSAKVLGAGLLFGTAMFIAWLCVAESIMTYAARQPWAHRIVRSLFRSEPPK